MNFEAGVAGWLLRNKFLLVWFYYIVHNCVISLAESECSSGLRGRKSLSLSSWADPILCELSSLAGAGLEGAEAELLQERPSGGPRSPNYVHTGGTHSWESTCSAGWASSFFWKLIRPITNRELEHEAKFFKEKKSYFIRISNIKIILQITRE